MLNRIKLAIKIILGYDIIVYEENTKIVNLVINNNLDIIDTKHDYIHFYTLSFGKKDNYL